MRRESFARRFVWLLAAATAFAAWVFLHLPATDAVEWLLPRIGLAAYDRLWLGTAVALGIGAITFITWRERWTATPPVRAAFLLLVVVATAQALLLVAPIEYVHYPQYALVSFLLACGGLPLEIAWMVATASGAADELHQRITMMRGTPDYFDWNDLVLNGTGAAFGLVLLAAGSRVRRTLTFTRRTMLVMLGVATAVAAIAAPPVLVPYLTETPRHTWFRIASPLEAMLLLGLVWGSVRRLAA